MASLVASDGPEATPLRGETSSGRSMTQIPAELREYHERGLPLSCEIDVQPWLCEFWPLAEVEALNAAYGVPTFASGYIGFATSGGGEMYVVAPDDCIVCLALAAMSPAEALTVARC
jgi:NAD-dependent dihydropyrimidine dehydrogenase PreA subunit